MQPAFTTANHSIAADRAEIVLRAWSSGDVFTLTVHAMQTGQAGEFGSAGEQERQDLLAAIAEEMRGVMTGNGSPDPEDSRVQACLGLLRHLRGVG